MAGTAGSEIVRWSKSLKAGPSSDCGLKFAHMKVESLVIADQQAAVNTFPGLVHTARHTTKASYNRSHCANRKEAGAQVMIGDWGEVVTR
jgi:hypothetical protein